MARSSYRGKKRHLKLHPKIYVWTHTERAEIEYFKDFKDSLKTLLLMPRKKILRTPQELIKHVIAWKELMEQNEEIQSEDQDQVWCVFDVDDFYKSDSPGFLRAMGDAQNSDIKIAYVNECFEHWILFHFIPKPDFSRGKQIEKKIREVFKEKKLGEFIKNQKVFDVLLPFQETAIKNARAILGNSSKIIWNIHLSKKGNPSTSMHFLVDEINRLRKK